LVAGSGERVSDLWRISNLHLSRDFDSGRLFVTYHRTAGWDNRFALGGIVGRILTEPLCDEDKELIGLTPIPPKLAKVDL
jgi:hypothetical protein